MSPWTTSTALVALSLAIFNGLQHAKASDVGSLRTEVAETRGMIVDIRAAQIEDKILDARTRSCSAAEKDQRDYFGALAREYVEQYRKLTARAYMMPACNEV